MGGDRRSCVYLALQPGSVQESLKPAAALSIVMYTLGLPAAFLGILVWHRTAIHADQTLRVANEGASAATNPNYHIRMRYQELYRWVVRSKLYDDNGAQALARSIPLEGTRRPCRTSAVPLPPISRFFLQHVSTRAVLVALSLDPAQAV